jgi:acetyltransferase
MWPEVRSRSSTPENRAYRHMAIHPYPRRLVHSMVATDQQEWLLRPIRPEDASLLQEFIRGLSDESRYMRFVSMLRELTPRMLARYTRIDYDREVALVATAQVSNPENRGLLRERIVGFAHCLRNADGLGAEYALVIADDWQRRGLGARLMRSLIDVARRQQLAYIEGIVLASNRPMLGLMSSLGFRNDPAPFDPDMRRLWLDLRSDG